MDDWCLCVDELFSNRYSSYGFFSDFHETGVHDLCANMGTDFRNFDFNIIGESMLAREWTHPHRQRAGLRPARLALRGVDISKGQASGRSCGQTAGMIR